MEMETRARYSDTNLIINYLPQDMKDDELKYIFQSIGSVKRCRIIRDKTTGLSYGYAFCEFEDADDAEKAIENLNGLPIKNKKLKVAFARLPGEESKNCNVYVQNLPVWVTKEKLQNYFEQFGPIIQCRVVASGNAKAVGFCLFETRSAAQNAINELDGKPWPGSAQPTLRVRFADDSSKKVGGGQLAGGHMNDMPVQPNHAALIAAMNVSGNSGQNMTYMPPMPNNQQNSGAGPIRNHAFLRQGDNRFNPMADPGMGPFGGGPNGTNATASLFGKSSGIPNSAFDNVDDNSAMGMPGACDHPVANTKGVGVIGASGQPVSSERYIIYVYNIGNKMDDDHLFYMFIPFGNVVQANVARDKDSNEPKNYGFVTFSNYQSSVNAINAMNGFVLSDKILQVSFKK